MRITLLLSILLVATGIQAQTKKISWKSHSGNMNNFFAALESGNDLDNSNFGMAVEPTVRNARLDSVIFICDSVAVMVTSEYCTNRWHKKEPATKWKAGKDTVINHPVFSRRLTPDSIRVILNEQYYFRNEAENVVFVGLEESRFRPCEGELITKIKEGEKTESALPLGILVTLILLAAIPLKKGRP